MKIKFNKNIALIVILVPIIVGSLGFVSKELTQTRLKEIKINIDYSNNQFFVDENDIIEYFNDLGYKKDTFLSAINIPLLEKIIKNHPAIKTAEVYKTIDGKIHVDIQQRTPIVRIFNKKNDSFYIDQEGYLMPFSPKYTPRVLIANGYIFDDFLTYSVKNIKNFDEKKDSLPEHFMLAKIFAVAQYISHSEFWKAQIQQLYVNEQFEIELIPRVGNHIIVLGDTINLNEKFKKLAIFYQKGLPHAGWNKYSVINLKFKNQVVCVKR